MNSVWSMTSNLPSFPSLEQDMNADVLVIGGGMTGILCAYLLSQAGVDCILVEADRLCGGITQNTTAKITTQHGLLYDSLLRRFGKEKALLYLQANQAALDAYRRLSQAIPCHFEEKDAFVYSRKNAKKIEAELRALQSLGAPAAFSDQLPLPFSVAGAIRLKAQAQFHPLLFLSGLLPSLSIYEHTKVRELAGLKAITPQGTITAKRIIVATHFPFLNKHGAYFLKLYQHRSYVLALENAPNVKGMYVDEAADGLSFRNYENRLLLGGGDHPTGKQGGGWRELEAFAKQHYPNAVIAHRWATQDCMSLDGIPYIGPYSPATPGLFVGTGFNKWGMTSSMVAAMILTDLVQGKDNPYAPVFSPSRSMLRPQLFFNAAGATANLLTPTAPRCPHLGCALKWNPQERSWDCPCHGSRFSQEGHLLDNPATGDLKRVPKTPSKH